MDLTTNGFRLVTHAEGRCIDSNTLIIHAKHYDSISVHFNAFYDVKNVNFQIKNSDIFSHFCSGHRLWRVSAVCVFGRK